ncbi:MAG: hypothetical protein Kow00127_09770 [Bacteroidales bacterium]
MNLVDLLRLMRRNAIPLLVAPLVMGITVTLLTGDMPQTYSINTRIYTGLASGYSIESQENASFNYFAINNAFDNLINVINARSTIEETALRLYALHLMQTEPRIPFISNMCLQDVKEITPPEVFELVDPNSLENTYQNLLEYKNRDTKNFVYQLINKKHPHYSYYAVSAIKAKRIANSDMVEISYESDDPTVCYQTLKILIEVFIKNYGNLKENQTDAVVKYFEKQLETAHEKLLESERKLLNFNMDNSIINYYEQTKHIASEKESFEVERQKILLDHAAAASVISNLEASMDARTKLQLEGNDIVNLRQKLSDLNEELSDLKFHPELDDSVRVNKMIELEKEIANVKARLQQSVDSLHYYEYSRQGIGVEKIIDDWLTNVIAYEETGAKLRALEDRRRELDETIKKFAPLGANMKKIEREIDVREQEYLSLLHSLGLAKLKQQDITMSSNIRVVDPPVYPISPLPSKRKFLIIAAVMAAFVMVMAFILLIRFFDTTLQTTYHTEKVTGLKALGNFPLITEKMKMGVKKDQLIRLSLNTIINNIYRHRIEKKDKPFVIGVVSNFRGEGKSTIIAKLIRKFDLLGTKCIAINPSNGEVSLPEGDYDIVFIEYHHIIGNTVPSAIQRNHDLIIYIIRADRGWENADKKALDLIRSLSDEAHIGFILNAVQVDNMPDFVGPVPARRSKFRKMVKRIAKFRFYETFSINED